MRHRYWIKIREGVNVEFASYNELDHAIECAERTIQNIPGREPVHVWRVERDELEPNFHIHDWEVVYTAGGESEDGNVPVSPEQARMNIERNRPVNSPPIDLGGVLKVGVAIYALYVAGTLLSRFSPLVDAAMAHPMSALTWIAMLCSGFVLLPAGAYLYRKETEDNE